MGANNNANPATNISPNLANLSITMSLPQPLSVVGGQSTGGLGGVATDGVQGGASGAYLGPPPVPSSFYYKWKNPA
jgi:hypothetical protein